MVYAIDICANWEVFLSVDMENYSLAPCVTAVNSMPPFRAPQEHSNKRSKTNGGENGG